MGKKSKNKNRVWNLKVYWPDAEPEEIEGATHLDMDEGGYARWCDPDTGLYCMVTGMPVSAMEQTQPEEEDEDEDDEDDD